MKKFSQTSLVNAATMIGCDPAALDAVVQVESGGRGFDARGRPKILFEKHKFYVLLEAGRRRIALRQKLARKRWSPKQYGDQRFYDDRWSLLERARRIDDTAALKSCSWGIGQIMGFNHRLAGFETVQDMVMAFTGSEDAQLYAMAKFVTATGLGRAIADHDWRGVARVYNGPGQVEVYAARLAEAYASSTLQKTPETSRQEDVLRIGSTGKRVFDLQERLTELGYPVDVDGDFGPMVKESVLAIQHGAGLEPDAIVGPKTRQALIEAVPRDENRRPLGEVLARSGPAQAGSVTTAFGALAGAAAAAGSFSANPGLTNAGPVAGYIGTLKNVGDVASTTRQATDSIGGLFAYIGQNAALSLGIFAAVLGLYLTHRAIRAYRRRQWSW